MRPGVGELEGQTARKLAVHPNLKRMVMRVARGLASGKRPQALVNPVRVNDGTRRVTKTYGGRDREARAWNHVVVADAAPPQVQPVIPDVGDLHYGVLHHLSRNRN